MMTILQNRYEILQPLKQGGMGIVYLAHDKRLNLAVAVKELIPFSQDSSDFHAMSSAFKKEARMLANLSHPSIPKVIDYFNEDERHYFVMEFVKGIDLHKLLLRQNDLLDYSSVMNWFCQMLDIVEYLHNLPTPIFHRDLKPSNFKLSSHGKVVLLDFGIAKETDFSTSSIEQSINLATFEFAPLEQTIKASTLIRESLFSLNPELSESLEKMRTSAETDIFALAATLYRLLTLTLPANAFNRALAVWAGKPDPLLPISLFRPSIRPEIEKVIMQSLSLFPQQRPRSIKQLKELVRYSAENNNEQPIVSEPCLSKDLAQANHKGSQGSQTFFQVYKRKFLEKQHREIPNVTYFDSSGSKTIEFYLSLS